MKGYVLPQPFIRGIATHTQLTASESESRTVQDYFISAVGWMSFSCLIVLCPLTSFLFNDPHVEGGGGAVNPVLYPPSAVPRRSKCVYGQ